MRACRSSLGVACAASALLLAGPAAAANAYDQLVGVCQQSGGNCNPTVPDVPAPTVESTPAPAQRTVVQRPAPKPAPTPTVADQVTLGVAGALIQGLFAGLFSEPEGPSPEELARQEQQRLPAAQARAAAVSQQRALRNAEQSSNMDAMAAAMSSGWDSPVAAAAPGGTTPVALRGTTPALFAPASYPLAEPTSQPSPAADRLARMAAEDQDVAVLTQRLTDLSAQLEAARREADLMRRRSDRRAEEYQEMEQSVGRGVADAQERGMSMAFEGLLAGNAKALQALSEVKASGRAWGELKDMLREVQGGVDFMHETGGKLEEWSDDAAFATRRRDLKEDVAYLAKRLGGPYSELGESILVSARTVREQLAVIHRQGELNGFEKGYQARLDSIHSGMETLVGQVKDVRTQLARRTGIAEGDIALPAPPPHRGLGAEVPPLVE